MSSKGGGLINNGPGTVTVAVLGVSGAEDTKGALGVGKSLLCNRLVRGDFDNFRLEHSSVLSQSDFGGSPVISNDHWLYWGEALISNDELRTSVQVRVIEQTEFVDDENFEPFDGLDGYAKRATRTKLESADKLMYICREQLGLETEYEQRVLPESRVVIDGFIFVYDISFVEDRPFEKQSNLAVNILSNVAKTKRPVVIAASKADIADEAGRKALQRLLVRKELRAANLPIVEVSSFANVNILGVFALATGMIEKWKVKPRFSSFSEALKAQRRKEQEICDCYVALLKKLMPIDCWPHSRPTWNKLLNRFGLAMHSDYSRFVYVFGMKKATDFYQRHVKEAKEFWMQRRLQVQISRLPQVFEVFIGVEKIHALSWSEAKNIIINHPLFDEYFLPLGTVGADLDPSSKGHWNADDSRIPAEILLTVEAEPAFLEFQRLEDQRCQQEHIEEQFEQILAGCSQVTPGKPLEEVDLFLRGHQPYDALPSQLSHAIYARFQEKLVGKAEADFEELLLEQVQLFITLIAKRRKKSRFNKPIIGLDDTELSTLKNFLTDDLRYRQLNCLHELRDKMLATYASFVSCPVAQSCFSGAFCIESLQHEVFHSHLERRQLSDSALVFDVNLVSIGDENLVSGFRSAIQKVLYDGVFESEKGLARISVVTEKEAKSEVIVSATRVFLVDSVNRLEELKNRYEQFAETRCPPLIVLIVNAVHFDMLPVLHKEGCSFAKHCGGIFIGSGSDSKSDSAHHTSENELNTFFTRDQIMRVLSGAISSQISPQRLDARIQVSAMCGDEIPFELVFESLLTSASQLVPYMSGGVAAAEIAIPSLGRSARVEIAFSSYHSWFFSRSSAAAHGHVLIYSANRRASFAHLEATLGNFIFPLQKKCDVAFILVALVDASSSAAETNELLSKGRQLADSLPATFVVLSTEDVGSIKANEFLSFFEKAVAADVDISSLSTVEQQNYSPLTYHDYGDLNHSKSSGASSSAMDYTVMSEWSTGSHESTSSSRKSNLTPSDTSTAPNKTTSRSESSASHLHRAELNITLSNPAACSGSETSMVQTKDRPAKAPRVPHIDLSIASAIFPDGGVAPLATPEAADADFAIFKDKGVKEDKTRWYIESAATNSRFENLRDVNANVAHKAFSRAPRKTIDVASRAFTHLEAAVPSASRAKSPLKQYSKGNYARHTQNIFTSGSSTQEAYSNRLGSRLHSVSAESLVNVGRKGAVIFYGHPQEAEEPSADDATKKSTTSRFVRKVTSSFRFRRNAPPNLTKRACEIECDGTKLGSNLASADGSSSAPHSPQVDRSRHTPSKSKDVSPSTEKNLNPFSWFPSRSPRRTARNLVSESASRTGVIMPADTLESLATDSKDNVPSFVRMCIEYIEEEGGLEVEGLYRIPGNQAQVGELETAFVANSATAFRTTQPPVNAAATALKSFFANLPEPLIPYDMHELLVSCLECEQSEALKRVGDTLAEWPVANRKTFVYLGAHLARVALCADVNSMDVRNLAKVWWPTLFRPNFDSFESMAVFVTRLELAAQLLITYAVEQQH